MLAPRASRFASHPSLRQRCAGVILAGGQNSRMGGADKAFLSLGGEPFVRHAIDLLQECFPEVVVVTNHPEKYASFDVIVTSDAYVGRGPLAGIHAAMAAVRRSYVFVLACDMPFVRPEPIDHLLARLAEQDAVIPRWEGDIEPLHALYATRLRDRVEQALVRGTTAIRAFLPDIDATYVDEEEMARVPGAAEAFRNLNTPEEAARFAVHVQPAAGGDKSVVLELTNHDRAQ